MELCLNTQRRLAQGTRIDGWHCSFVRARKGRQMSATSGQESLLVCSSLSPMLGTWSMYPSVDLDFVRVPDCEPENITCIFFLPRRLK